MARSIPDVGNDLRDYMGGMVTALKLRFALTFLGVFALLIGLWWTADCAEIFRAIVLEGASWISPLVNGWTLDFDRPDLVAPISFLRGSQQLGMLLDVKALSMGLMPLLSLVIATPGQTFRRLFVATIAAGLLYVLVDIAVIVAYPFIMNDPNPVKDTLGVFSGLVAFVVAPLALWFIVTYPTLQSLWKLSEQE